MNHQRYSIHLLSIQLQSSCCRLRLHILQYYLYKENKILYALGSEYLCGVMKSNLASDPFYVKEPSKNITHVWCVSIKIDSSENSIFSGRRLCIGTSTNWSKIDYPLIAFFLIYIISTSLSIMTHLANLPIRVALLSKFFNRSIFATSHVLWESM